ncbi:helix-turn-helix domain-containing protein [Pelagibius sp. Alg239-R121]|uniref:helix-turn-helix domain-containing protein n=1 Tax=Pelagibius sp. Alg239-R121 TaxID=2993448 RepID=UPI0024A67BE6|nr:helix-turn-helix transcriptional regulator [Pelagibius sp. Alg239-R121]
MSSDILTSINAHIAARIRTIRRERGLTLKVVSSQLGIALQQLQKYERGKNRVCAARLYQIADVLETNVEAFFAGYNPDAVQDAKRPADAGRSTPRLMRQFEAISSTEIKKSIYGLVLALNKNRAT